MAHEVIVAIVNPAAGGGRGPHRWARVARLLKAAGWATRTFHTERRGDGTRLAREAASDGAPVLVAVGGDGTVNEVVNGLEPAEGVTSVPPVAIVPAGTGMDVARNARIPRRPEEIARAIVERRGVKLDVGVVTLERPAGHGEGAADGRPRRRFFVNFAEVGLGAAVVAHEARYSDRWPGRLSYLLAAVTAGLREAKLGADIWVDGEAAYAGELVSVVVANGSHFGGGMRIAPCASMMDGELDVVILGDFSRAELVSQIWKVYPGVHVAHEKVRYLRGRRVKIEPRGPARLDLDGELHGSGPYTLSVLPDALFLIQ